MACPFFYPVDRFDNGPWAVPPRLPLGDPYRGECRASDSAFAPDEQHVRAVCNLGYGRNRCDHFPQSSASDAVRFHIAEDAGELIRIQFIFEKDCWPREHGTIECSAASGASSADNAILQKQAGAFLDSYLRRRE